MESGSKPSSASSGGGYGYNYGGNYAGYSAIGYGYGYGGENGAPQRNFQDYLLILRERIWYIVVVFLVVFSSALVYTLSQTKIYQSTATVQINRRDPMIMQTAQVTDTEIRSAEDLNTQVKILESAAIIQKVAERITGDDLRQLVAPYEQAGGTDPVSAADIIARGRKIAPQRLTLIVLVQFQHPDRAMAAKIANFIVEEYITYNARVRIDESLRAVEELKGTVENQRRKVSEMSEGLQAYKEKNNLVSLDQRKDIVNDTLKTIAANVTLARSRRDETAIRWNQIRTRRETGGDLTELPFIAGQAQIAALLQQRAAQAIQVAQLRERYREKHPDMQRAIQTRDQTERELSKAVDSAAAAIKSEFDSAEQSLRDNEDKLAKQTTDSLALDRQLVEYAKLERDFQINLNILNSITGRRQETTMNSAIMNQNARSIDKAVPSLIPISPNVTLNLGLGFVGGLVLGLAFAFFVAFVDDRVKSSFDIEGVVGLPLIGIIPQIKRMEQADKAQIVVNNADRQVSEAFLALHSSLRLKDESKNAKCILTTSTIPGEGKSFTTTNLALTFAAHGERVVIVDCDLRKPNIHKSFRVENLKGVIDVCAGTSSLDDVIIKNLQPNLDIIPAGGRAKNPTQILNSKNFEIMVSDLRKRYDRVFVDTPPLAAVSDALIILPLMDGSLFTIFFNKVRRKAAQFAAKKLIDANVPNFGAVLNGLNLAVSGYYYAQYYDKSYKDYYVVMSKNDESKSR